MKLVQEVQVMIARDKIPVHLFQVFTFEFTQRPQFSSTGIVLIWNGTLIYVFALMHMNGSILKHSCVAQAPGL